MDFVCVEGGGHFITNPVFVDQTCILVYSARWFTEMLLHRNPFVVSSTFFELPPLHIHHRGLPEIAVQNILGMTIFLTDLSTAVPPTCDSHQLMVAKTVPHRKGTAAVALTGVTPLFAKRGSCTNHGRRYFVRIWNIIFVYTHPQIFIIVLYTGTEASFTFRVSNNLQFHLPQDVCLKSWLAGILISPSWGKLVDYG